MAGEEREVAGACACTCAGKHQCGLARIGRLRNGKQRSCVFELDPQIPPPVLYCSKFAAAHGFQYAGHHPNNFSKTRDLLSLTNPPRSGCRLQYSDTVAEAGIAPKANDLVRLCSPHSVSDQSLAIHCAPPLSALSVAVAALRLHGRGHCVARVRPRVAVAVASYASARVSRCPELNSPSSAARMLF
eukprot:6184741-Pleurochrysis_carterae.AAC.1